MNGTFRYAHIYSRVGSMLFKRTKSYKMDDVIVHVKQGSLRGKIGTDYDGRNYYRFLGIPYAKPPIGKLRFKAPQPADNWIGIRDATKDGSPCISLNASKRIIGSEDCLFLNVYTPELPKESSVQKPVMVWIHGGKYTSGSNNSQLYGPEFLLTGDVVVVTINYRLGVLGFLAMDDLNLNVPGNAGFKDMIVALKWVQANITSFGGDPNNVTIFGASAGGKAVHLLLLSPMAKGLFHKAIAQSGAALSPSTLAKPSAKELALALKCPYTNEKDILQFLQELPAKEIYQGQTKMRDSFAPNFVRLIGPVIEKISPNEPAFLSEDPLSIILNGNYQHVPFIMGYNSREGLFFNTESNRFHDNINVDFEEYVPHYFKAKKGSAFSRSIVKKIEEFYFGGEFSPSRHQENLCLLQTDSAFLRGIYISVKSHTSSSKAPIYFYKFSVDASRNFYKTLNKINSPGAAHCDDLAYLFNIASLSKKYTPNCIEDKTIRRMVTLWTNFAKTGDPNPIENVTWKPATKSEMNYLDINDTLVCGINPEHNRMKFWDQISEMVATVSKL